MESLLSGQTIREIARRRHVRVGCVYAQRSKAIIKLRKLLLEQAASEHADTRVAASARG